MLSRARTLLAPQDTALQGCSPAGCRRKQLCRERCPLAGWHPGVPGTRSPRPGVQRVRVAHPSLPPSPAAPGAGAEPDRYAAPRQQHKVHSGARIHPARAGGGGEEGPWQTRCCCFKTHSWAGSMPDLSARSGYRQTAPSPNTASRRFHFPQLLLHHCTSGPLVVRGSEQPPHPVAPPGPGDRSVPLARVPAWKGK